MLLILLLILMSCKETNKLQSQLQQKVDKLYPTAKVLTVSKTTSEQLEKSYQYELDTLGTKFLNKMSDVSKHITEVSRLFKAHKISKKEASLKVDSLSNIFKSLQIKTHKVLEEQQHLKEERPIIIDLYETHILNQGDTLVLFFNKNFEEINLKSTKNL